MTGKNLIEMLQKNGWVIDRTRGSHYVMKKNNETIVVPRHNADLKIGLLNSILKKAKLK